MPPRATSVSTRERASGPEEWVPSNAWAILPPRACARSKDTEQGFVVHEWGALTGCALGAALTLHLLVWEAVWTQEGEVASLDSTS
jgi:hypothetical protein